MNKVLVFFALFIILIFGAFYFVYQAISLKEPTSSIPVVVTNEPKLVTSEIFVCNQGKTIDASFFQTVASTTKGGQETLIGSVTLKLSDERSFNLPQTISADGGRYATTDNSFVFWNKGNGALVLENGDEKDYVGCVVVSKQVTGIDMPMFFADAKGTFSLRLPKVGFKASDEYSVDQAFKQNLSPANIINGVKFTIPESMATGTNLSKDTYISVEHIPETLECNAELFFNKSIATSTVNEGGFIYSVATSSGAAAGNRYEEIVYAIKGTNPCVAVRYFIHSTAFENYEEGTIKKFDMKKLITSFDQIRQSLVINQ